MDEQTKKKISRALKGIKRHPLSEETKMKLRLANLGKKQSSETIAFVKKKIFFLKALRVLIAHATFLNLFSNL